MSQVMPKTTIAMIGTALLVTSAVSAGAQQLTYSANPPRTHVRTNGVSPQGIPQCETDDPTSPTTGVIFCYTPGYIWTAYNILSVLQGGNFGQGQTIVIVDAIGSPTIQQDLTTFHQTFFGASFPAPDFEVVCAIGCPTFNPRNAPQASIDWSFETTLDVEWAHAIAPLAKIKLVVAPSPHGNSINEAVKYAVANYPGSIISQSIPREQLAVPAGAPELRQRALAGHHRPCVKRRPRRQQRCVSGCQRWIPRVRSVRHGRRRHPRAALRQSRYAQRDLCATGDDVLRARGLRRGGGLERGLDRRGRGWRSQRPLLTAVVSVGTRLGRPGRT